VKEIDVATLKEVAERHLPGWKVVSPDGPCAPSVADETPDLEKLRSLAGRDRASPSSSDDDGGPSGIVTVEGPGSQRKTLLIRNGEVIAQRG
jgi:hypothetical protein